jgi:hypothetical protein
MLLLQLDVLMLATRALRQDSLSSTEVYTTQIWEASKASAKDK